MKKRTSDLLNEMLGIFGNSFGSAPSLTEDRDLDEASAYKQNKMAQSMPSKKRGKERHVPPTSKRRGKGEPSFRGGKYGALAKSARSAATPNKDPEKQRGDVRQLEKDIAKVKKSKLRGGGDSKSKSKSKPKDAEAASAGGGSSHNPFTNSSSRGKGPGTPPALGSKDVGKQNDPRTKKDSQTNCWSCNCSGDLMNGSGGCLCTSSGNGKNCPPAGREKKISYVPGYKKRYNDHYHAWKAKGGGPGGKKKSKRDSDSGEK